MQGLSLKGTTTTTTKRRVSWARKHHMLLGLTIMIDELEVCFGWKMFVLNVDAQEEGSGNVR